jgi:hypothetical protein
MNDTISRDAPPPSTAAFFLGGESAVIMRSAIPHGCFAGAVVTVWRQTLKVFLADAIRDTTDLSKESLSRDNKFEALDCAYVSAWMNQVVGAFIVKDARAGRLAIRGALARIGLLPFSEIAYLDRGIGQWQLWYPKAPVPLPKGDDLFARWVGEFKAGCLSQWPQWPPKAP